MIYILKDALTQRCNIEKLEKVLSLLSLSMKKANIFWKKKNVWYFHQNEISERNKTRGGKYFPSFHGVKLEQKLGIDA